MNRFGRIVDNIGIGLILLILCLVFYLTTDLFLTKANLSSVLLQTAVNIVIAVGMTFVISAAEIDLSVGSLLAVCSITVGYLLRIDPQTQMNIPMMIANYAVPGDPAGVFLYLWWGVAALAFVFLALLPGAVAGGIVGILVAGFGIPSFIVTLGFMLIYRGLARYLTDAFPVTGIHPSFAVVGDGNWFQLAGFDFKYAHAIALLVVVGGFLLLGKTRFGRYTLAVGGNRQAAYLSGMPVWRVRCLVFVVSGVCVSIAAILLTARLNIGDPNAGEGYELDAIAAVIIGGTSLFGGKGTVIGTFFGALIIAVLRNGLDLLRVNDHIKLMAIGAIIIFAVLLDYYRRKLYRSAEST